MGKLLEILCNWLVDLLHKLLTKPDTGSNSENLNDDVIASEQVTDTIMTDEETEVTPPEDTDDIVSDEETEVGDESLDDDSTDSTETAVTPEIVEEYCPYTSISGTSVATVDQMKSYIKKVNPNIGVYALCNIYRYIDEGDAEGIRGDIAFAQSCLETGNFTFEGSAVTFDQYNFCGMGVTSKGMKGNSFETFQLGVRAQIQHLKAYANDEPLVNECVDPRFKYVVRGSAKYVDWLGIQENPNGRGWAAGKDYGNKIIGILDKILEI